MVHRYAFDLRCQYPFLNISNPAGEPGSYFYGLSSGRNFFDNLMEHNRLARRQDKCSPLHGVCVHDEFGLTCLPIFNVRNQYGLKSRLPGTCVILNAHD